MSVLVVGDGEPAGALTGALRERGAKAELVSYGRPAAASGVEVLAQALVELERRVDEGPPRLVLAVGDGDVAIAAALVAVKAGVDLVACLPADGEGGGSQADERRVLGCLAALCLELPGSGAQLDAAAERVASFARR